MSFNQQFVGEDVWVTADHHFHHRNIIDYTDRPYQDHRRMNEALIKNYRSCSITEDSTVVFAGDLMLGGRRHKDGLEAIIDRLPGRKHLVLGNHDRLSARDYMDIGFGTVHSVLPVRPYCDLPEREVLIMHDPAAASICPGTTCITAHVHNAWKRQDNCINCGVDVRDYAPVRLRDLLHSEEE